MLTDEFLSFKGLGVGKLGLAGPGLIGGPGLIAGPALIGGPIGLGYGGLNGGLIGAGKIYG